MKFKRCTWCKRTKHINLFYKRNNRKNGITSRCGECINKIERDKYKPGMMRPYDIKKLYGITQNDYINILIKQDYKCAICKKPESEVTKKHKKFLCIDHNHIDKKVRGLLCDKCNRGLGLMCDNTEILHNAIIYLNSENSS